ncbi:ABC transporter substrate-binding protein [Marinomonas mediterranea]|uniref:heme/hemin ABC transporter substrate-binding protein n=1 Tax=Marinomonas mediterranea TaxID=119864 RepID=UPI00234A63B3|nr:ABC transporter substrate-binding protein [Marinomonas mediterranea]WCN12223.1 ABC transporter substrate-binding protein [Marinomonas mediterranea]
MKALRFIVAICLGSLCVPQVIAQGSSVDGQRIITVDGGVTEIAVDLGATDRIVGVDSTSLFIPDVRSLPVVGYMRALSSEGLLSLNPDILITTSDAGPPSVLSQVERAKVRVENVDNAYTFAGIQSKIAQIGHILNLTDEAVLLEQKVAGEFSKINENIMAYPEHYKVMFVMDSGERGFMVSGKGTRAAGILDIAGLDNAFADVSGYKALTPESALLANPDVILVFHSKLSIDKIKANPAIRLTDAVKHDRVFNVDSLNLLNFGSNTGQSVLALQEWLLNK